MDTNLGRFGLMMVNLVKNGLRGGAKLLVGIVVAMATPIIILTIIGFFFDLIKILAVIVYPWLSGSLEMGLYDIFLVEYGNLGNSMTALAFVVGLIFTAIFAPAFIFLKILLYLVLSCFRKRSLRNYIIFGNLFLLVFIVFMLWHIKKLDINMIFGGLLQFDALLFISLLTVPTITVFWLIAVKKKNVID
jgi:hypothetical protein